MATVEIPQHMQALAQANRQRLAAAELKGEIKRGETSLAAAIEDSRAGCLTVIDLLMAQRGWGVDRAAKLLDRERIYQTKRVRALTERQRGVICQACS
jgi:hypothetical protein